MTLDELLTKERSQYLQTFQLGVTQYKTAKSAIEVMIQATSDQNRNQPEVYQLNRYDLINVNSEGKYDLTEFNLEKDSVIKFEKQIYNLDKMSIVVSPFVWNGCEIVVDQKLGSTFEAWCKKWIDIDDKKAVGADGLQNVIHSVTIPEEISGKWTTSIDFGTAPTDAFKDLLKSLSREGVKEIEVHSKTFIN